MFMRPEIYALSEPNLWQEPANPRAIPLDIGNPIMTDAANKQYSVIMLCQYNLYCVFCTHNIRIVCHSSQNFQQHIANTT